MRLAALTLLLTVLAAAPAQAMRCGTHLVVEGDSQEHVLRSCGDPVDLAYRVEEETVLQNIGGALFRQTRTVTIETWVYNFGPSRFMERLELRDGRVTRIETLGRGYRMPRTGHTGRLVRLRDTRAQVLAKWGEPTRRQRERQRQTSSVYVPSGALAVGRVRLVEVESWTYDWGPRRFVRRVVFEDGLVVRVETLSRGS